MSNFVLSYDLNGSNPSHKQVDEALGALGAARGRLLETVWYVGFPGSSNTLFDAVNALLSPNDQLLVVEAKGMVWRNLLVGDASLHEAWNNNL